MERETDSEGDVDGVRYPRRNRSIRDGRVELVIQSRSMSDHALSTANDASSLASLPPLVPPIPPVPAHWRIDLGSSLAERQSLVRSHTHDDGEERPMREVDSVVAKMQRITSSRALARPPLRRPIDRRNIPISMQPFSHVFERRNQAAFATQLHDKANANLISTAYTSNVSDAFNPMLHAQPKLSSSLTFQMFNSLSSNDPPDSVEQFSQRDTSTLSPSTTPTSPFAPSSFLFHIPPLAHSGLSAMQYTRALELVHWSSAELAWKMLPDPKPMQPLLRNGRHETLQRWFYFNCFTAKSLWHLPQAPRRRRRRPSIDAEYDSDSTDATFQADDEDEDEFYDDEYGRARTLTLDNQSWDESIPLHGSWFRGLERWMAKEKGIKLLFVENNVHDRHLKNALATHASMMTLSRASMRPMLFYAHVLHSQLFPYPPSFFAAIGVRHIVIGTGLSYKGQTRAGVPLVEDGTLVLEPRWQDIVWVASVLHHELFHIADAVAIWKSLRWRQLRAESEKENNETNRNGVSTSESKNKQSFPYASGWTAMPSLPTLKQSTPLDFTTPLPPLLAATPPPPRALLQCAALHGHPDPAWSHLNIADFKYGKGGKLHRHRDGFLSIPTRLDHDDNTDDNGRMSGARMGFINGYSQSAIEEDKAEIFAALMRDYDAMIDTDPVCWVNHDSSSVSSLPSSSSDSQTIPSTPSSPSSTASSTSIYDPIVRSKARELCRRLVWLCPHGMGNGSTFWMQLRKHSFHPMRHTYNDDHEEAEERTGTDGAASNNWELRHDHEGHGYFFNTRTKQVTWVRPIEMARTQLKTKTTPVSSNTPNSGSDNASYASTQVSMSSSSISNASNHRSNYIPPAHKRKLEPEEGQRKKAALVNAR